MENICWKNQIVLPISPVLEIFLLFVLFHCWHLFFSLWWQNWNDEKSFQNIFKFSSPFFSKSMQKNISKFNFKRQRHLWIHCIFKFSSINFKILYPTFWFLFKNRTNTWKWITFLAIYWIFNNQNQMWINVKEII